MKGGGSGHGRYSLPVDEKTRDQLDARFEKNVHAQSLSLMRGSCALKEVIK